MDKLPLITSAFLNLTNSCNLACRYCFVEQKPEFMALQTAIDAADFLARNAAGSGAIPSINFFGGEPLLMWDEIIVPLTQHIRETYGERFTLSMTSNCTLLDRQRAEFMRDHGIGLLFSMDGDRRTQERNRPMRNGNSSFDVLEEKIPIILEYFPDVMFRATVTPETVGNLYHDMMYAERKGFKEFFTMPNCFEPWGETEIEALQNRIQQYADHYVNYLRHGQTPIFFSQLEKYFRKILMRNDAIANGHYRTSGACLACGKCGLGSGKYAGININGDVLACQEFFSHCDDYFAIGNIYTGVREDLRSRLIANYDAAPVRGDGCDNCPLDRICDGGCVANNYLLSGDIHRVPAIYCQWNRILFDAAVYIMEQFGAEENKAFKARWLQHVR